MKYTPSSRKNLNYGAGQAQFQKKASDTPSLSITGIFNYTAPYLSSGLARQQLSGHPLNYPAVHIHALYIYMPSSGIYQRK